VVAVNYQEPVRAVQAYVRELGVTFPILRDAEGQVARELHGPGLPATFLIGRDGAVIGTALGYRDWNAPEARAFISELLAAPPRGVAAR
jgi:peroxiredoxin